VLRGFFKRRFFGISRSGGTSSRTTGILGGPFTVRIIIIVGISSGVVSGFLGPWLEIDSLFCGLPCCVIIIVFYCLYF